MRYSDPRSKLSIYLTTFLLVLYFIAFIFFSKSYSITCTYKECTLKEKAGIFTTYKEIYKFNRSEVEEIVAYTEKHYRHSKYGRSTHTDYIPAILFKDGRREYVMPFKYHYSDGINKIEEIADGIKGASYYKFSSEKNFFSWLVDVF